jgi:hypothetical protein
VSVPINRAAPAPPPVHIGLRPPPQAIRGWQTDTARRAALAAFIAERGSVSVGEAVLCTLYWVEANGRQLSLTDGQGGTADGPGAPRAGAPGCEIVMLYPFHNGRRLTAASNFLRRFARLGLVESMGEGWYRTTPRGRLVVETVPDHPGPAELRRRRPKRGRGS